MASPEEVAAMALYLFGRSFVITGNDYPIDGGFLSSMDDLPWAVSATTIMIPAIAGFVSASVQPVPAPRSSPFGRQLFSSRSFLNSKKPISFYGFRDRWPLWQKRLHHRVRTFLLSRYRQNHKESGNKKFHDDLIRPKSSLFHQEPRAFFWNSNEEKPSRRKRGGISGPGATHARLSFEIMHAVNYEIPDRISTTNCGMLRIFYQGKIVF